MDSSTYWYGNIHEKFTFEYVYNSTSISLRVPASREGVLKRLENFKANQKIINQAPLDF
jgi:hypothetical protein